MAKIDYHTKGPIEKGLCGTCAEAVTRTFDNGVTEIRCTDYQLCRSFGSKDVDSSIVTRPVARCSAYRERGHQDKVDLERIAWVIETPRRGPAGFLDPQKIAFRPPKLKKEEED